MSDLESARGLILFVKADNSVAKAAQTVGEAKVYDLYKDDPSVTLTTSGNAFAAHNEAGGDWKNWAEYALSNFDFFILYADDLEVSEVGDTRTVVIGKGTFGILDEVDELGDILVYYQGDLYDCLGVADSGDKNWKRAGLVTFEGGS